MVYKDNDLKEFKVTMSTINQLTDFRSKKDITIWLEKQNKIQKITNYYELFKRLIIADEQLLLSQAFHTLFNEYIFEHIECCNHLIGAITHNYFIVPKNIISITECSILGSDNADLVITHPLEYVNKDWLMDFTGRVVIKLTDYTELNPCMREIITSRDHSIIIYSDSEGIFEVCKSAHETCKELKHFENLYKNMEYEKNQLTLEEYKDLNWDC